MHVAFEHCGQSERVQLVDRHLGRGPLRCKHCEAFISAVDVAGAESWIEAQVARKQSLASRSWRNPTGSQHESNRRDSRTKRTIETFLSA